MGMLKEFRDFAMKGNLIDIAVGFVMGAAFKQVVTSFTGGIVSPIIGLIFHTNFKDMKYILKEGIADKTGKITGEVSLLYGDFITNLIDFIIVAFVMFILVKAINKIKIKEQKEEPATVTGPTQEDLLAEIRDLLAKK